MLNKIITVFFTVLLVPGTVLASFVEKTPEGLWRSIDDVTHKPRALITISKTDEGTLQANIQKTLPVAGKKENDFCVHCKGELKNKPIKGLRVVWGMQQDGNSWVGGQILDPKNGKIYRCKMQISEDGSKLSVRGYVGLSLLGRTQIWERIS